MSHIFISYSKQDIAFARHLRYMLLDEGFAVWMDELKLVPSERWWPTIERNIVTCAAFIVIMSPNSHESDWVEREILVAENRKNRKPIFPVLLAGEAWARLGNVQYEDMHEGLEAALSSEFVDGLKQHAPTFSAGTPPPLPSERIEARGGRFPRRGAVIGIVVAVVALVAALLIIPSIINPRGPSPTAITPSASGTSGALVVADGGTPTPSETTPPAATLTDMPTLSVVQIVATLDAQATVDQATANAVDTAAARVTAIMATTQAVVNATTAATRSTPTPTASRTVTPNMTASIDAFRTERAATATATLWTATPTTTITPASDPVEQAVALARNFRGGNDDWRALYPSGFEHDFDGVTMVLVPPECFTIGAKPENADEQNGNRICFDQPFWIDRTEVTQSDFARLGGVKANANGFDGGQRPVENITWFEAVDFCARRDAVLLTEAAWEFAARGPDEWDYPWGNEWNGEDAVWNRDETQGTADVGSLPAGASWVGALDMSGNVREWNSSLSEAYPYNADDGREAAADDRTDVARVLRGGSWEINDSDYVRAGYRYGSSPGNWASHVGFRCARLLD